MGVWLKLTGLGSALMAAEVQTAQRTFALEQNHRDSETGEHVKKTVAVIIIVSLPSTLAVTSDL